jgi:hypothetical protein
MIDAFFFRFVWGEGMVWGRGWCGGGDGVGGGGGVGEKSRPKPDASSLSPTLDIAHQPKQTKRCN